MLDGPIGAAAFNNEFGRPGLGGFFRVYEQTVDGVRRGFHKPIMSAGGLGTISADRPTRSSSPRARCSCRLGGPGMRIGMGGGAASSMAAGRQRRRAGLRLGAARQPRDRAAGPGGHQPLLGLGDDNPILAIHDVGAGGLSNAFPELVDGAGLGARFDLRPCRWRSRARPKEAWCNESQERYVLALAPDSLPLRSRRCASVSAAPTPSSGSPRRRPMLVLADGPDDLDARTAPSTCRWRCCSASRRRCCAT
jgi:phosphoribosylformylglycinamidine synthase